MLTPTPHLNPVVRMGNLISLCTFMLVLVRKTWTAQPGAEVPHGWPCGAPRRGGRGSAAGLHTPRATRQGADGHHHVLGGIRAKRPRVAGRCVMFRGKGLDTCLSGITEEACAS